jgi:hypothetical protein
VALADGLLPVELAIITSADAAMAARVGARGEVRIRRLLGVEW